MVLSHFQQERTKDLILELKDTQHCKLQLMLTPDVKAGELKLEAYGEFIRVDFNGNRMADLGSAMQAVDMDILWK